MPFSMHGFLEKVFSVRMLLPLSVSGNIWLNCTLPLRGTSPKILTVLCSGLSTQVALPSLEYVSLILGSGRTAHMSKSIFVCSGCDNKISQTGCLKWQTFISYSARGSDVQDQGAGKVVYILKTLPLAWRHCVLPWPLRWEHMVWGASILSSFSIRALITSWGPYPDDFI